MYHFKFILGLVVLIIALSGCGPTKKYSWEKCYENPPVVSTVDYMNGLYEVVQCDLPRAEAVSKSDGAYVWKMPSGNTCAYKEGPDARLPSSTKAVYGLRNTKTKSMSKYCEFDIGFMPVTKDKYGVLGFNSYFTYPSNTNSSYSRPTVKIASPEFRGGQLYANTIIFIPLNREQFKYRVLLRKKDGSIVNQWNYVHTQQHIFKYIDDKGEVQTAKNMNFMFELGNNIAFVYNKAKSHVFEDEMPDKHQQRDSEFVYLNEPKLHIPQSEMNVYKEADYTRMLRREELRKGQILHIVNSETLEVVESLPASRFKVQPMAEGKNTHWNIIGPLKGNKGLYGFIQEDGSFKAPPGTLGVRPAIINTRIQEAKDLFNPPTTHVGRREHEQPLAQFWLLAYDNKKGGISWGRASADFSVISGPVWSDIKQHDIPYYKHGWLFARNISNGKWVSLDDFKLPLQKTEFSSAGQGMSYIQKTLKNIVAVRQGNERKEMHEERHRLELARSKANKSYYDAKRRGDVRAMRVAVNNNAELEKDFLLSGYGTDKELELHIKYTVWPGPDEKKMQAMLDNKRNAEKARLEQQRKNASLQAARQKELERLQRYENKRKDLENWRNTVNTNIKRTNNTVNEQWGKHQTEMYEKGYIELPK